MIGAGQHQSLVKVIEDVEAAITAVSFTEDGTDATAYSLLDRVDQFVHLGVIVAAPESRDTHEMRRQRDMRDDISVELRVHLARTPGQRETRNAGIRHEERIREAVCGGPTAPSALGRYRPTYQRTDRTLSADRAWLSLTQTFTLRRLEVA